MISIENCIWRKKVAPALLQRFDDAIAKKYSQTHRMVLEYRGNFSKLQLNIEVLSAIDGQLQVSAPLCDLPRLAALDEIKTIRLHSGTC